ncbi:MAG: DUF1697 domain-containing protein [bacterium]
MRFSSATRNAVFDSDEVKVSVLSGPIREAINNSHGFAPEVILLGPKELEAAIASNPYPEAENVHKTLYIYFLRAEPQSPNLKKLEAIKRDNERYA